MAKYEIIRDKSREDIESLAGKLSDVRDHINWLIEDHGEDAWIEIEHGYDGYAEVYIYFDREETDRERNKRLTKARKECDKKVAAKAAKEEKERKELTRLLKKYGED